DRGQKGLWIRAPGRSPRRVATTFVRLSDVHRDVVGWTDAHRLSREVAVVRLRAARATEPPRTLEWGFSGGEGCDLGLSLGGPLFDDGHLYWGSICSSSVGPGSNVLKRTSLALRRGCASVLSGIVSPARFDFDF